MKSVFPALCWAVLLAGVLLSCAKKPAHVTADILPGSDLAFDQAEVPMKPDPNESVLDLDAPIWTIYFDFDSFSLKEAYKAAALGEYLKKTGRGVFLTGYASEEGTDEYNLALGARRAQAVRTYLEAYGVPTFVIEWKSLGEENPVTHDPEKFFLNRRVEVQIEGVFK